MVRQRSEAFELLFLLSVGCGATQAAPPHHEAETSNQEARPTETPFPFPAPTISSLQSAFPDRAVWEAAMVSENAPDTSIRTLCVGPDREHCLLAFSFEEDGRLNGLTVTDPSFEGPRGLRVGARFGDVASVLETCSLGLGDPPTIQCVLAGHAHVGVTLDSPLLHQDEIPADATLSSADLEEAVVHSFVWQPAEP